MLEDIVLQDVSSTVISLSIALSSSKSRFDSASSVFFFSAAIFNLTWSTR